MVTRAEFDELALQARKATGSSMVFREMSATQAERTFGIRITTAFSKESEGVVININKLSRAEALAYMLHEIGHKSLAPRTEVIAILEHELLRKHGLGHFEALGNMIDDCILDAWTMANPGVRRETGGVFASGIYKVNIGPRARFDHENKSRFVDAWDIHTRFHKAFFDKYVAERVQLESITPHGQATSMVRTGYEAMQKCFAIYDGLTQRGSVPLDEYLTIWEDIVKLYRVMLSTAKSDRQTKPPPPSGPAQPPRQPNQGVDWAAVAETLERQGWTVGRIMESVAVGQAYISAGGAVP